MGLKFIPMEGTFLDTLEKIAIANKISHFNFVRYNSGEVRNDSYNIKARNNGSYNFCESPETITLFDPLRDREQIESLISEVESSQCRHIGVSSLVRKEDSKPAHLFQIDYDSRLTMECFGQFLIKLEKNFKSSLEPREGNPLYLFSTEGGYHIYGGAMEYERFSGFMNSLHDSDVADSRWIKLGIGRGFSNLRISKNQFKREVPTLVGRII